MHKVPVLTLNMHQALFNMQAKGNAVSTFLLRMSLLFSGSNLVQQVAVHETQFWA